MRVKIKINRRMKKQKLLSTGGHLFQRFSICAYSCPICEAELFEHTIGSLSSSNQQQLECHIAIRAPLQGDTAVEIPTAPEVAEPEQKACQDINHISFTLQFYIYIYISGCSLM